MKPREAVAAATLLCLCGCGSSQKVPSVASMDFVRALTTLRAHGFRVAVPSFPAFPDEPAGQGRGRLPNYVVVTQRPRAGASARRGATVTLALSLPAFRGPLASIAEPIHHPARVTVPDFVGRTYPEVMPAGGDLRRDGLWVRVGTVGPLTAGASVRGLAAFRVLAQSPRPGAVVPYGGLTGKPVGRGVQPAASTVTIALIAGSTTSPAARVEAAIAAVRSSGPGSGLSALFPATPMQVRCRIPRGFGRFVPGVCTTSVELRRVAAVVRYIERWDGRDFRAEGAPARPGLSHTWAFTVVGGRVVRTRMSGAFPPQFVS